MKSPLPATKFGLQTSVFGLAVLVAGGFHTQAMAKILKDKQISYAILSPKLTEIDPTRDAQYLEAFAQDRTPLDKLMLGEKIFLSAFRSMGQVPGNGIVQEFEPNVALRSNFHGALEAGLNLDELLSQTKASQSEAQKIISGLQKLIENKLPFIRTMRFLDYAKTRDGGAVLPMLVNDGEGFAVEIHPKGWTSRKVTVAGMVDGELTRRSFRIRSLTLGERLSFQVPPSLPKTMKTASAWALFPIVPKETFEMAIKSTGSAGFNTWLAVTIGILAGLIGISIAYRIYKYRLNQAKETSRDKFPVPITAPKKPHEITITEDDAKLTLKELLDKKKLTPMVEGGATVLVIKRGKQKRQDWVVFKTVKEVNSYPRKLKSGNPAVRDNGSLQSVMKQVYIDGELRNRINTESFIKTLTGSGQKAGVRIFTSDFYGWTPVNNEMAKLVRILLLVTNNIMVDMTTGIDRAYEIKKVVNKQA